MSRLILLANGNFGVDKVDESKTGEEKSVKTVNMEIRVKTCDPTNTKPRHKRPKVSAVSWTIKRAFNV